ncbi:Ndr family [Popillia japonica]|uniref:Ndr family n=1 Tax=Popillia japonica TaxID=7064 RepID=A0AAW1L9Q1_POPJA
MPVSLGGSYHSLTGSEDVYRSTTVTGGNGNVLDSVKKALNLVSSSQTKDERLITAKQPIIISSRTDSVKTNTNKKMPTSGVAEEAALLGTMPSDSMDDIELKNIQLQFPSTRSMSRDDSTAHEETVETDRGPITVAVQGCKSKPAIVTYHDLGLNYISSFQAFFNYIDMRVLMENFCVYHVNAPGQEEGAPTLPEDYVYPSMDELAHQLDFVLSKTRTEL